MTFLALLTKELRLRMRRERTIWVIIVYILLMGLLGWFYISSFNNNYGYNIYNLSNLGTQLYTLLSQIQLFLILFITPAFTSTAVNGEKERQTFDLLLCSRLSSFALVTGKLVAGLANALLLIAASAPLFSLVFFFGGVSPTQVLTALLVFVVTAVMVGTFGLFCSTVLTRPAVSTAVTYMTGLLWLSMPLIIYFILIVSSNFRFGPQQSILFIWNPIMALISTYPDYPTGIAGLIPIGKLNVIPWAGYTVLCVAATFVFLLLSMLTVKPQPFNRLRMLRNRKTTQTENKTAVTAQ
jgi:ABC-type transport system involved in multi-copper enzyme maturation permease subunit